jgi:hypothetical protein
MANKRTTKFFEAISKTKPATEKQIREAVRRLVVKMLKEQEEEEETAEEDPTAPDATNTDPKAEPQAEPQAEPAPEEEEGLNADFQTATDMFIRKLTQSTGTPAADDLVDMLSQVIEHFTTSSEERLNLLKGIRNNTVH